ncbi:kinase-like domain-containing protein [Scleroderma citrinum]
MAYAASNDSSASPMRRLLACSHLISQGAEAKVYKAYLKDSPSQQESEVPVLLKYRFNKRYRHPLLDASLTRQRLAGEARALMRCLRFGVNVPGIRMVDAAEGILGLEWIDGKVVRALLPGGEEEENQDHHDREHDTPDLPEDAILAEFGVKQGPPAADALMSMIGIEIAKMHLTDIIHGDLTTSNMMLRKETNDLVLIDFGLAYHSTLVEDKAVDLYVLERAFASTHPDSEPLFGSVLASYEKRMEKQWLPIKKRLDDVRLRGRKRSMVG